MSNTTSQTIVSSKPYESERFSYYLGCFCLFPRNTPLCPSGNSALALSLSQATEGRPAWQASNIRWREGQSPKLGSTPSLKRQRQTNGSRPWNLEVQNLLTGPLCFFVSSKQKRFISAAVSRSLALGHHIGTVVFSSRKKYQEND